MLKDLDDSARARRDWNRDVATMLIRGRKLAVAASLVSCLSGCALMGPDYSVSKVAEGEKTPESQLSGHWLSDSDLRVTLYFPLDDAAKLPVSALKADVSGDLITLHLDEETDQSAAAKDSFALCDDMMKLTYVLHKLPHRSYRVQVAPVLYGTLGIWDIEALEIN